MVTSRAAVVGGLPAGGLRGPAPIVASFERVLRDLVAQVVFVGLDRLTKYATEDRRAVGALMD
jgi:hypothetical protein